MYKCWNCGLTYGSDEDWEPSRLCPACKEAMGRRGSRGLSNGEAE